MVDSVYRSDSRRVFATLVRLLGDFDLAEDALHDAFAAALEQWPRDGVPTNPRAWLVSTGRFRAIDGMRRAARFDASLPVLAERLDVLSTDDWVDDGVEDDRLRLILTCCHPALSQEARVALTLREVCGLTTEEIARAFLTATPTIAQRIVRAKAKIRDAGIPYRVPSPADLPERLDTVLHVVYLVFNESRRKARTSPTGDIVLLADQDRTLWNRDQIAEGEELVKTSLLSRRYGPYTLQAAIAAVHSQARDADATDWAQIVSLYDVLLDMSPSPVVALNRAAAVAMQDGPAAGLHLIDTLLADGHLSDYHLAHSARADLLRRLGRNAEGRVAYQRALALAKQEPERRFLQKRLCELPQ
jgi:RNA polymerase sigma-70 factor (ECF subfamily)